LNDSDLRGAEERKFRVVRNDVDRLVRVTKTVAARPDVADMIASVQGDDLTLYDHVRTKTFERMRRQHSAGPGPFSFEDKAVASDTVPGRLYRNLVGRPLVPLIAKAGRWGLGQ